MYLLAPFTLQDLRFSDRQDSQSRSRVMRMCNFRTQNGPFTLNKISLVQTIIITFVYLLALFITQNFKIFLRQILSYEDASFLGPK